MTVNKEIRNYTSSRPFASKERNGKVPAVVLGLGLTGINIVRTLSKIGVKCYGLYWNKNDAGRISRHCKAIRIPRPGDERNDFLPALIEILINVGMSVIFPTDDRTLAFISEHRASLKPYSFFTFRENTVERLLDKWHFYRICRELGMPAPKTILANGTKSEKEMFPCVCKPRKTWLTDSVSIDKVQVCADANEFGDYIDLASKKRDYDGQNVIVQKIVPGPDTNLVFCAVHMEAEGPSAILTGRKIHQNPPGMGVASACLVEPIPKIVAPTVELLQHVGYTGPAEVEYKWDENHRIFRIIEVNPRAWTSSSLGEVCGAPIIWNTYVSATGKRATQTVESRRRIVWIDEFGLLKSLAIKIKRRENDFNIHLMTGKRKYGYADISDPGPFAIQLYNSIKNRL